MERRKRFLKGMVCLLTLVIAMSFISQQQEVHSKQELIKKTSAKAYPIVVSHNVKPGETLFSITRKYYPSVDYMTLVSEYNGIINPTKDIKAGMDLNLPEPYIIAFHTVQEGETIYGIAKQYYSSQFYIDYLSAINDIKNPSTDVKVGNLLKIPSASLEINHSVKQGDTLYSIMMKYYKLNEFIDELMKKNSIQDPSKDVHPGLILSIGNPFFKEENISISANEEENISIPAKDQDLYIVINKGKNTLQVIKNEKIINAFPVGTGKTINLTPIGEFKIINKLENPWYKPKEIRGGDPKNPLGTRWLGLEVPNTNGTKYGIHGTNNPSSIGGYVSLGCIRMNNEDVEWLYNNVSVGTKVLIKEK